MVPKPGVVLLGDKDLLEKFRSPGHQAFFVLVKSRMMFQVIPPSDLSEWLLFIFILLANLPMFQTRERYRDRLRCYGQRNERKDLGADPSAEVGETPTDL